MEAATSPTVRIAVEAIRSHIRSGAYRSGGFLPPETELAATLDVSRGTIRRAIEVLVGTGEITKRPFSRPMIEAKTPAAPPTGSEVHVWISRPIADGASLQFLRGISAGLMGTSYRMVVREPVRFYGDFVKAEEREFLLDLLNDNNAVGAILERDSFAENDDVFAKLVERGKHLVFVDIPAPAGIAADHVGTANVASARKCVSHLLELGHHDILFATDTDVPPTIRDRMTGYWRALRQAGMEDTGRVLVGLNLAPLEGPRMPAGGAFARLLSKGAKFSESAQRIARDFLALSPRPTAMFVSYDVLAFEVCAILESAGVSIPGDLAVVGFDWLGRWEDPTNDILTTASQDFEGFGSHAADLLLDRAAGCSYSAPRHVLLEAPLVVRRTTTGVNTNGGPQSSEARQRLRMFP